MNPGAGVPSRRRRWKDSGNESSSAVAYLRVSTKEQAKRGGEEEGYSIPAQREACLRKAADLGLTIERFFIDPGESGRSANRPDLQEMLKYLAEHPVRAVIVHKIDRLARDRAVDVEVTLAIKATGANIVSVTENIDETPQGKLMHTIFSGLAAFYSDNLATEVIKGTQQKVLAGGTPSMAPLGYRNIVEYPEGREVRTVVLDGERAEHIRWAFEAYATGDWSLNQLATELELRGLTTKPTATRPASRVAAKRLQAVLNNPYYMGIVTWRGMEYQGKHPAIVSPALFEQVQQVLAAHRQSGERSYRRRHYLAGTLYCDECGSKLIFMLSRGARGGQYGYWACIGRHSYKNGCELPYLADERVEDLLIEQWRQERVTDDQAAAVRDSLLADLADYTSTAAETAERLDRRIVEIKRDRLKWAQKAMDGVVPDDIAREQQAELGRQLGVAETERAKLQATTAEHEKVIRDAALLLTRCDLAYSQATQGVRREYNQAWFEKVHFGSSEGRPYVGKVERTALFEALTSAEVTERDAARDRDHFTRALKTTQEADENGQTERPGTWLYRVISFVGGSKVACVVGADGFEPPTARV